MTLFHPIKQVFINIKFIWSICLLVLFWRTVEESDINGSKSRPCSQGWQGLSKRAAGLCVLMRLAAFSTQDRRVMSVGSQSDIIRTPFCPRSCDVITVRQQCDQIDVHTNNEHGFNIREPKGWSLKTYKTLGDRNQDLLLIVQENQNLLLLMMFWTHQ